MTDESAEVKLKPLYGPASGSAQKRGLKLENEIGYSLFHEVARLLTEFGCETKKKNKLKPKEHIDVLLNLMQYTRPRLKPAEEHDVDGIPGEGDGEQLDIFFGWTSPVLEKQVDDHAKASLQPVSASDGSVDSE